MSRFDEFLLGKENVKDLCDEIDELRTKIKELEDKIKVLEVNKND